MDTGALAAADRTAEPDVLDPDRHLVVDVAAFVVLVDEYGYDVTDRLLAAVHARLVALTGTPAAVTRVGANRWLVDLAATYGTPWQARHRVLSGIQMRPLPVDGPVRHLYFHAEPPPPTVG